MKNNFEGVDAVVIANMYSEMESQAMVSQLPVLGSGCDATVVEIVTNEINCVEKRGTALESWEVY